MTPSAFTSKGTRLAIRCHRYLYNLRNGGFLEVVLEHKSWLDPGSPGQLSGYMSLAAEQPGQEGGEPTLVMGAILYHGKADWNLPGAVIRTMQGYEPPSYPPGVNHHLVCSMGLLDLDGLPFPPETWALAAMLTATPCPEVRERLDEILLALPEGSRFASQTLRYMMSIWDDLDRETLEARLKALRPTTGGASMHESTRKWLEGAWLEGETKGRAEGEARGRADALLKQLQLKFERLPAEAQARVNAASADQVDAWLEAVLTAGSLEEVFASKPAD